MRQFASFLPFLIGPLSAFALTLAPPFTDHAVLQCEKPLTVWGTDAAPGATVRVSLANREATTAAALDGRWSVTLSAFPPGGPYTLRIRSGDTEIRRDDILLGEVWLCAGQSNMNWGLIGTDGGEALLSELAATPTSRVRLLRVPQSPADEPVTRLDAVWTPCTPATARDFSAIGYRVGRAIEAALNRPVGLIHANWGGTPAEAWMPREILLADDRFANAFERYAERLAKANEAQLANVRRNQPAASWNGIIHPLVPYTARGVLWYQGEANIGRPHHYAALLRSLIQTWRKRFLDPSLPFLIVQLPRYAAPQTPLAWAELRAAQASVLDLPATTLAVTVDCGNPDDIHPRDKAPVADRLARLALRHVYGHADVLADAPRIASVSYASDGFARVTFADSSVGLRTTDGAAPLGFELAGADGVFHSAEAALSADGQSLRVHSPAVPAPSALRYAWADAPEVNLLDRASGLPLAPHSSVFRILP